MTKMIIPMLALVAGIAFSAFTHHKTTLTTQGWFIYDGSGDPNDPDSYTYSASDPGCSSDVALCAVDAEIDPATMGGNPADQKPLASGGTQSLDVLSSQSQNFTRKTDEVLFHN